MADSNITRERDTVFDEMQELYIKTANERERTLQKNFNATLIILLCVILILCAVITVLALSWSNEQGTIVPQIIEVEKEVIKEVPI